MLMQLRDDVVPNVECLTDQHFQFNQTRRIMHLLLMYTRKEYTIQLVHVGHSKGAMIFTVSTCKKVTSQSTQKIMPCFHLHLACAIMIHVLVHQNCHQGVHLCQQNHS